MKNIKITIFDNEGKKIGDYISDLVPQIGDQLKFANILYVVSERIFIGNKNQVELILDFKLTEI